MRSIEKASLWLLLPLAVALSRPVPALAQPVVALVASAAAAPLSPAQLYGELFERVQMERVFEDGKTFVDATARSPPQVILAAYEHEKDQPGFDLKAFVLRHFDPPKAVGADAKVVREDLKSASERTDGGAAAGAAEDPADRAKRLAASSEESRRAAVREHIDRLWPLLTRPRDEVQPSSSLLPLPHPYVVPGGRFREIYYWDSYFTMIGLEESGRADLANSMVANFAHLADKYGHIPNGNRTYYLSRSQPPFFAAMIELTAKPADETQRVYLSALVQEYRFWMAGAEKLQRNSASRRVVRLAGGEILNRYWDDRSTPREESYREDVTTARAADRPPAEVYRNLRAAAESGWDFSSRWLADGRRLDTIHTVDFVPVDLNSLLYRLEQTLATAYAADGDQVMAQATRARAWKRRQAIHRYLWDEINGTFVDYNWRERKLSRHVTAASLSPLYFGVATPEQSKAVATVVRARLLQPDGLATTTVRTGQQWDAPNGWAPLQWIAIRGLRDNGEPQLAREIACRWIKENVDAYVATGKLFEKYDISGQGEAGGGEYPTQDGFGWTNGVLRKLLVLYPEQDCAKAGGRSDAQPGARREAQVGGRTEAQRGARSHAKAGSRSDTPRQDAARRPDPPAVLRAVA